MTVPQLIASLPKSLPFAIAIAGRDLKGLHRGSVLGVSWLVLRPFAQTAVYVLIVGFIFGQALGPDRSAAQYALYVLSGLVAWQAVQRAFEEAPSLIRERMEVLRQIIYPIETLPVSSVLTSLVSPAVSLATYAIFAAWLGKLSWTAILLPLPVLLLLVMLVGASWLLMVGGVVMRDLREIVALLLSVLVYASPVVLSESLVGPKIWSYVLLNPLSHVVICFRDVLGGGFHAASWIVFGVMALGSFFLGAWLIARVKLMVYELI
jgi:lipopolysaccharide transport system permease protein